MSDVKNVDPIIYGPDGRPANERPTKVELDIPKGIDVRLHPAIPNQAYIDERNRDTRTIVREELGKQSPSGDSRRTFLAALGGGFLGAGIGSNLDKLGNIIPTGCSANRKGYPFESEMYRENDKTVIVLHKNPELLVTPDDQKASPYSQTHISKKGDVEVMPSSDGTTDMKVELMILKPEDLSDLTINSQTYDVTKRGKSFVDVSIHPSILRIYNITADSIPSKTIGTDKSSRDLVLNFHSKDQSKFPDRHITIVGHGVDSGGRFACPEVDGMPSTTGTMCDKSGVRKLNIVDSLGKNIDSVNLEQVPLARDFKRVIDRLKLIDEGAERKSLIPVDINLREMVDKRFRDLSQSHGIN